MPPTKNNVPSKHDAPLRRSSPRLLERNISKTSKSTATKTAASSSSTQGRSSGKTVYNSKVPPSFVTKKLTNSPINAHQRGKDIGKVGKERNAGGDTIIEKSGGGDDVDRSLHVDFDVEEDGSDTDSFVSTLGFYKDTIDGKSGDELGKVSGKDYEDEKGMIGTEDDDNSGTTTEVLSPVLLLPEKKKTCAVVTRKEKEDRRRTSNYTELEDVLITKAFVSVSKDPINGSQQRANIFWAKVHQKYKLMIAQQDKINQPEVRTMDSVKQRYTKTIARETGKFNKFYISIKNQNKSGWNEDNYVEEAERLYEEECNKPFNFLSCKCILSQVVTLYAVEGFCMLKHTFRLTWIILVARRC